MNCRYYLLLLFLFYCGILFSKNTSAKTDSLQNVYKDYHNIVLEDFSVLTLENKRGKLFINQENSKSTLFLTDNVKEAAKQEVYFNSFIEISDISAWSEIPKGNKYKKVKVKDFKTGNYLSRNIFYDDGMVMSYTFPSVSQNVITNQECTKVFKNPRMLPSLFFQSNQPVLKREFVVKASIDIDFGFKGFNLEGHDIEFKQWQDGEYNVYKWTCVNSEPYKTKRAYVSGLYYIPHIRFFVKSYQSKDEEVPVCDSVSSLYNWYYGLVENLKKPKAPELEMLVNSLNNEGLELDRVKNIFKWVQSNINYLAFEDGMRGFQPDKAINVYRKKYGDCKDMSSLLIGLLNAAELEGHFGWTGSRDIPYSYYNLPTLSVDNHMIAVYQTGDATILLDATDEYLPFGLPPYSLQNKEVLIEKGPNNFEIYKVPVIDASLNSKTDYCTLTIGENTKLIGKGECNLENYYKNSSAHSFLKSRKEKKSVRRFLSKGNNKFYLKDYAFTNLENRDTSTLIKYDFELNDYVKQINNEYYINLNLNRSYTKFSIEEDDCPIENRFKFTDINKYVLEIPDGYSVGNIPEDKTFKNTFFEFEVSYTAENNKILYESKVKYNYLILEPEDFHYWHEFKSELKKAFRQSIVLTN